VPSHGDSGRRGRQETACDDFRILVLSPEIENIVDGDHLHRCAERSANPLERPAAVVESSARIFVVRGDEHDVAAACKFPRDIEAGQHRHTDIEEGDVGPLRASGASGT
jgi:hypothetical protein